MDDHVSSMKLVFPLKCYQAADIVKYTCILNNIKHTHTHAHTCINFITEKEKTSIIYEIRAFNHTYLLSWNVCKSWGINGINFVKLIMKLKNDSLLPWIQRYWSIENFLLEHQLFISIISNIKF